MLLTLSKIWFSHIDRVWSRCIPKIFLRVENQMSQTRMNCYHLVVVIKVVSLKAVHSPGKCTTFFHQPLPISHSQSRVTPANIPPSKNTTSKFPNAFCSGPCTTQKKTSLLASNVTNRLLQNLIMHILTSISILPILPYSLLVQKWAHKQWGNH